MPTITRRTAIRSAGAAALGSFVAVAGCDSAQQSPLHLSADRRFYHSAAEVFAASDAVVRAQVGHEVGAGHVKKLSHGRLSDDKSLPTRIVTESVLETYKGRPGTSIRVAQIHGTRADGVEVIDDADQLLQLGAEYVLFLDTFAETPSLAGAPAAIKGGSQGQFRVSNAELRPVSDESAWSLTLKQVKSMR